jgi:hypothetical protein
VEASVLRNLGLEVVLLMAADPALELEHEGARGLVELSAVDAVVAPVAVLAAPVDRALRELALLG